MFFCSEITIVVLSGSRHVFYLGLKPPSLAEFRKLLLTNVWEQEAQLSPRDRATRRVS